MDLQTLFYITGILFMLVVLILFMGIGVATFLLVKRIQEVIEIVSKQAKAITYVVSHPGDLARDLGASVAKTVAKRVHQTVRNLKRNVASTNQ